MDMSGQRPRPVMERFENNFIPEPMSGCHLWIRATDKDGYALFKVDGKMVRAHRWIYRQVFGIEDKSMVVDHICRTRSCVNPGHLRLLTNRANILIGVGKAAQNARKTKCKSGHPLSGDNTIIDKKGHRHCRECTNALKRSYYQPTERKKRTHCRRGHLMDEANSAYWSPGVRTCRACHNAWKKRHRKPK